MVVSPPEPGDDTDPAVSADEMVAAVARAVGGLQMAAVHVQAVADRSERNRLNLLHLHGAAGMYVGPLFAAIGAAGMTGSTWSVLRLLPFMPYSMGVLFFVGGTVLYEATTRRMFRTEIVGLVLMAFCYLVIAVSFAASVAVWMAEWPQQYPGFYASIGVCEAVALLLWAFRRIRMPHMVWLHLMVGWSVGFAIGLFFTGGAPEPRPSMFAHGVYAHLSAVLVVHLGTLAWKLRQPHVHR
jgi:hypothetical protein